MGIAVGTGDLAGWLFVSGTHRVMRINLKTQEVTPFCGGKTKGYRDGPLLSTHVVLHACLCLCERVVTGTFSENFTNTEREKDGERGEKERGIKGTLSIPFTQSLFCHVVQK